MFETLCQGLPLNDARKLKDICLYAKTYLDQIKRRSGESYATHGMEVASIIRECTQEPLMLKVAVLHDLFQHPEGEKLMKNSPLTKEEQSLAKKMHELRRLHIDSKTKDLDQFLEAMMEDSRLLTLRMAHRLNDVRNLERFKNPLKRDIARESLHMYSAIAGRLGLHAWRYEMEDICFKIVHPKAASNLIGYFDYYRKLDHSCLNQTARFLKGKLKEQGIKCKIEKRIKGLYSSYRKMVIKSRSFEELTDRLAIRIIVDGDKECYLSLGVVHASTHPIPGKLKDYIGAPKENGYQSIHTVIYPLKGVTEQPIEIQIRTAAMHKICEFGNASHGNYKNRRYSINSKKSRVNLFRNLEQLRAEAHSPKQFEIALRRYFADDHIALFDKSERLYHLKSPATALDFIHHTQPSRLVRLKNIRINGRSATISTPLKDGDVVEASFGRKKSLMADWKKACRHPKTLKEIEIRLRS